MLRLELAKLLLFFRRRGHVDPLIEGLAEVLGDGLVEFVGRRSGLGTDFRRQQAHNQSILVGGPHRAVPPQERSAGAFLAAEREGAVDQPGAEPFEAHGDFHQLAADLADHPVDHGAGDRGLADGAVRAPVGAMGVQKGDGGRQIGVGVHQAAGGADDPMAVGVGVVGEGDVEPVVHGDQAGHGVGRRAVHADLAVPVDRHEAEGRVDGVIDHRRSNPIALDDRLPVVDSGAAQGIDADANARSLDRLHVHHLGEVGHIGSDVVIGLDAGRLAGAFIGQAKDADQAGGQEIVGRVLDPAGDVDIGRAAIGRIVFEAALVRRVVRRADDDTVRQAATATAVIGQDGVGDHRRGRITALVIDPGVDVVGGQHLDGAGEGGLAQGVGVHAQEQGTVDPGLAPIQADRLGDSQDMGFVEGRGEGRAPVS